MIALLLILHAAPIPRLVIDWESAYRHAKAGKTVRLQVQDRSPFPDCAKVEVRLVYQTQQRRLGAVNYSDKVSGFTLDLSTILRERYKGINPLPLHPGTKIVLVFTSRDGKRQQTTDASKVKVELLP